MFRTRTVLVVGAGASSEIGLPIGSALKEHIARKVDIRFNRGTERVSGDELVYQALRHHVQAMGSRDTNPYLHAGWAIRDGLPLAISIDNYLDVHSEDERVLLVGKLGIVSSILDAERGSPLYTNPVRERGPRYEDLEKVWYGGFFKLLTEGLPRGSIDRIFENVAFVIFNYDRCVEEFLRHAIGRYYGVSDEQVLPILRGARFVHPYGVVGAPQWSGKHLDDLAGFGADVQASKLLRLSGGIKTFTETAADPDKIAECMDWAERVIFLGFSYQTQNMALLETSKRGSIKSVFGSAYGMSGSDERAVAGELCDRFGIDAKHTSISKELTCAKLFGEYWRTIAS